MARVIFSPITAPMLPPMNFGSMAQMWTCASFQFAGGGNHRVFQRSRGLRGFQPLRVGLLIHEFSGSEETRPASYSS